MSSTNSIQSPLQHLRYAIKRYFFRIIKILSLIYNVNANYKRTLRHYHSTENATERRKRQARERQLKYLQKKMDTPEKMLQFKTLERKRKAKRRAEMTAEQIANERKMTRDSMSRKRARMTTEQTAVAREKNKNSMSKKRAKMTTKEKVETQTKNTESHSKKRKRSTPEQIEEQRKYNREKKKAKRAAKKKGVAYQLLTDKAIEKAKKEALKYLHRNRVVNSNVTSRPVYAAHVCVICDSFIIGTEPLKKLTKKQIKAHSHRLSLKAFEEYYQIQLPDWLVKQYTVSGFKGLLLSPRAQKIRSHYVTCSTCYKSMSPSKVDKPPPKFSIANGFVIGRIPKLKYKYERKGEDTKTRELDIEEDEYDILRVIFSPKRPFGYVFAFTGGRHQAIRGHYQFFEMEQSEIGSAINMIDDSSLGPAIFCMCSGRFTPDQRDIVRRRCEIHTGDYLELYRWFVQESGHPSFRNLKLPNDIPKPHLHEDSKFDIDINTDEPGDVDIENTFEGARYYFSSGQDPTEDHSVYGSSQQFSVAMMKCKDPTLLTYGGKYANMHELNVEEILPLTFPSGLGGPTMKRRVHVSKEACLRRYSRIALPQFLRSDAVLILNHMFGRIWSFKSGVMTSRNTVDGVSLGEKLASLTIEDLNVTELADGTISTNSEFENLMRAISTSCRSLGHTTAAAKEARMKNFAMMDYGGVNALYITITPNDEGSFRVRLFCMPGTNFKLPNVMGSEEECMLDLHFRKKMRLRYPGACSLEYQSLLQIVLECLFQWDPQTQKAKGPGICGTLVAFAPADEEQQRFTLHRHWQLWVQEIDQSLRKDLFHNDKDIRKKARSKFYDYIDKVMSASYGNDLEIKHYCNDSLENTTLPHINSPHGQIRQLSDQTVRDARCKELSRTYEGHILQCDKCNTTMSTIDVVNLSLRRWKHYALQHNNRKLSERTDAYIPMTNDRLEIASLTHSYHMNEGCEQMNDDFWGDHKIRKAILTFNVDEHDFNHRRTCFKKGCECRFFFPFTAWESTTIHEDRGDNDEHVRDWHNLDGTIQSLAPWLIMPKRPMGCQFVNAHNDVIQELLNCNTNVQIGDPTQVYYNTLYNSKSTQVEDAEQQRRVGNTISKRLLRIQEEIELGVRDPDTGADLFVEGLSRLLSGINAATTRDVLSAPMAHLLTCNNGTRFQFSHDFSHLLITQLEATLEGQPVKHRIRINKFKGKTVAWNDSSSEDYIGRPVEDEIQSLCSYEFTMLYKKCFKTVKQVEDMDSSSDDDSDDEDNHHDYTTPKIRYSFIDTHPGCKFSHLIKRRLQVIPIICLPREKLCRIENLELDKSPPTEETSVAREDYAKMALMMFYPFRCLEDLKSNDSYWSLFKSELDLFTMGKPTTFWKKGFTILQNIQDRYTLEKKLHRAKDPITLNTTSGQSKVNKESKSKEKNEDQYPDITDFTTPEDQMEDHGLDVLRQDDSRNQSEIINRTNHNEQHLFGPRPSSDTSLLQQTPTTSQPTQLSLNDDDNQQLYLHKKSYRAMLKLILTAVTDDIDYTELFSDSDYSDSSESTSSQVHSHIMSSLKTIPSMEDVAKEVKKKEKLDLDEKQYIAYEAICATFLLSLVTEGLDDTTSLGMYLKDTVPNCTSEEIKDVKEELEARGGTSQLIMFLSGPAGAGKTSAVKVAEKFCYRFCVAIGSLWHDTSFLFTAYTGSAASHADGVTICKVGYINKSGDLSLEEKLQWKHVKILIIDEISFMKDDELVKLDRRLKECRDRTKIFGGISIIFSGDFRQLEPSGSTENDLLFSLRSSQIFENNLNAVIFLDNVHRFKDDQEYGEMLKRMWFDDLSKEDRERINTRVIGRNGIQLPPSFKNIDGSFACPTNKERNSLNASQFKQHVLRTCPHVTNDILPSGSTCIVEANISSSTSKRSKIKINRMLRHRIITTCGDDNVKAGTKPIDPALCLYVGAFVICIIPNDNLNQKVRRGNGTMCRVVGMKLKPDATSYKWKNYYNRKVWTVNAKDVEWIELEHHPKSRNIVMLEKKINKIKKKLKNSECDTNERQKHLKNLDRLNEALLKENKKHRFTLKPQNFTTLVSVKPHQFTKTKMEFTCRMTQLPLNLNDATTGHKLQGMSKDAIIITSWPKGGIFKNWEYVVLSRVRSLSGLYLFKPIDMNKSFKPSEELVRFFRRAHAKQKRFLNKRNNRLLKLEKKKQQRNEI